MNENRVYAAIDLKSFYASVEAVSRNLDPLKKCLVVADSSRTEKTICLAVSPPLKSFGIPGRPRLFEVNQKVREINRQRAFAYGGKLRGYTDDIDGLKADPGLGLSFIVATPRMKEYMRVSSLIYKTYTEFISPEDIHVYSIDEVFIDLTPYLNVYNASPHELVKRLIKAVYSKTKITATAGIGTNLYLAKIAMDIMAKHEEADEDGVRIAYLDEKSYRESLWDHKPLRDFWRVGQGYVRRLAKLNCFTMGDIAKLSLENEDILYGEFGVNAELLIDHAWGKEPCMMKDIKAFRPSSNSISSGQVLSSPYPPKLAKLIVKEMTESLCLDLVEKKLYCSSFGINLNYESVDPESYEGELDYNRYGKLVPKSTHGLTRFPSPTHSRSILMEEANRIFDRIINLNAEVRGVYVVAGELVDEARKKDMAPGYKQLSLFDLDEDKEDSQSEEKEELLQNAILSVQKKYGKNSVLKGNDFLEGGTKRERNDQVGGHKG
ncbi:MAG: DNA methylase [Bacilli bacterium]|nr:DNA methylase [Bacilli bacterium]